VNSDGSYNSLDNETINVEYIIHPPTNLYTTQATTARLFGDVDSNRTSNNNDNVETDYNDNTETDYNDNSDSDTDPDN
jgi:hypothetical protein